MLPDLPIMWPACDHHEWNRMPAVYLEAQVLKLKRDHRLGR
jgi:hypothetical protein